MLKRLSLVILVLTLLASIVGCTTGVTSDVTPVVTPSNTVASTETAHPSTTSTISPDCGPTVPSDFYIIYEASPVLPNNFVTLLDTEKNILGAFLIRLLVPGGYTSVDYRISCEHLQALYDAVVEYNMASYAGVYEPELSITDSVYERITFCLDGKVYSITCDFFALKEREEYRKLQAFRAILRQCYTDNDEYRSLEAMFWPS